MPNFLECQNFFLKLAGLEKWSSMTSLMVPRRNKPQNSFGLSLMLKLLNRMRLWAGMDRPVFYTAMGRAWTLFSGPVTSFIFVPHFFTPEAQGYYYTFGSVVALQVFLELGFSQCIVQFASHEFAHLRFQPGGALEGDSRARARLISLGRLSLKWYAVMTLLVVIGLGVGGYLFFSLKHDASVSWAWPWWSLCLATGATLAILPIGALLEGCNQLAFIYGLRTLSAMVGSLIIWLALWGGLGLFSGTAVVLAAMLIATIAYAWRWPGLLKELWRAPKGETISWRREIWPFQWRIAISWLSGYFIFNFFTPVLFYFHGPVVAGQMGATMQLVNSLNALAYAWVGTKAPRYGMLISRRQFEELDHLFFKSTAQAVGICAAGGLALLAGLMFVQAHFAMGARFLGVGPTSLLVLATVVNQVIFSQAVYLRAHKREPFMWLSLVNGMATALLVVVLGWFFNAWGVCVAYCFVQVAILAWAWAVWKHCRRTWHQPILPAI
jgi:O-antigen/teichoic acid export membrane protein